MRQYFLPLGLLGQALLLSVWMFSSDSEAIDGIESQVSDTIQRSLEISLPKVGETLRVLTFPGISTWRQNREGDVIGVEADLVASFARSQGWKVKWVMADSREELFEMLEDGEADMAAAGLTLRESRADRFRMKPAYLQVTEQVACHYKFKPLPRALEQLEEVDLHVERDSSFEISLIELAKQKNLDFNIESRGDVLTEDLMREVAEREADCMVADSNQLKAMRRVYPDLKVSMDLPGKRQLGWYFPQRARPLNEAAQKWFVSKQGKRALLKANRDYFDYIADFDFVEMQVLRKRIKDRLPKYKDLFLAAEKETGIPADLLAAVAYQESHWNPVAKSPTGVRGMMMLTRRTAESLGVGNRLDPKESIQGGARYLKDRYDRQSSEIPDPDRLYFALASYNVGHAHVLDARKLASALGKNPDSWDDIRQILPLKADRRYYQKMRYGYARGHEPVHYVRRIRNYRDVIQLAFAEN